LADFARQLERELAEANRRACEYYLTDESVMVMDSPEAVREARKKAAKRMIDMEHELAEARELLIKCLSIMPVGYVPTHTAENLPEMIGDLAKALAEETTEREQLERELAEAREIAEMQKETMRQMREQYGIGERNVMRELRQEIENLNKIIAAATNSANASHLRAIEYQSQCDTLAQGFDAAQQAIVEAVKQRDALAEALDSSLGILIALMDGNEDVYDLIVTATNKNTGEENKMSVREALEKSIAALAAVKGGSND
jgi:uncharacterized protein YggE